MMDGGAQPSSGLGGFQLVREIGRGGMGIVYEARARDGTHAAVKFLQTAEVSDELRLRFEREATVRIDHPNVVKVLAAGSAANGSAYIAFELLTGRSLRDVLEEGPLPMPRAVNVCLQAARGLAAVHAHDVIHRDLKPGNLFLCADGTVKVLDFGVSLLMEEEERVTQGELRAIGTPSFLAPEQAQGDPNVDARADVWSLGVVLYEMLCGVRPFKRGTPLATMLAVVIEEPPPLSYFVPGVPRDLEAIVHTCIQKKRSDRYESATALAAALESVARRALPETAPVRPGPSFSEGGAHITPLPTRTASPNADGTLVKESRIVSIMLASGVREMDAIRQAVTVQGGLVVPILGRVIGLFGGEAWEGDEVARAATAALGARRSADRVAVAAGRAALAGGVIRGRVVRRAERGCALAARGVAVDGETALWLRTRFAMNEIGEGFFELTAEHDRASSTPSDRLIGRSSELAQIRAQYRRVFEEREAHGVIVTGPAGIGKSRLRRAFEEEVRRAEPPPRILQSRARPLGRTVPLGLFADSLRQRLQTGERDLGWPALDRHAPASEPSQAIAALLEDATDDERLRSQCAPFLAALLGVTLPSPELDAARDNARLMADRLRLALRDYVGALLERGPLVVVFEDLQWADAASLELLSQLLEQYRDRPLLLFGTARPWATELDERLLEGPDVMRMELRGLGASASAELAEKTAGRPLPELVVRGLVERTYGNPLFIEQIVIEIRAQELPENEAETPMPLPLTVEAAVQSRLDHLPHLEKNLCKHASVLGRPFTEAELGWLGISGAESLLRALRARGIVAISQSKNRAGEQTYGFRSALVAEVAYTLLTDDAKRTLHRDVARMMASAVVDDDEEVAYHHDRAGLAADASRHYVAATLNASRLHESEKVLRCAKRALELGFGGKTAFAVHVARAEALHALGRFDEQGSALDDADRYVGSERHRATVLGERVAHAWFAGDPENAVVLAEEAARAARCAQDAELEALAWARQATALAFQTGRGAEAQAALARADALVDVVSPAIRARVSAARYALEHSLGNYSRARDAAAEAARICRETGDLRRVAIEENNAAVLFNRVGAYSEAEQALLSVTQTCRRLGLQSTATFAWMNIADARTSLGRVEEALEAIDAAGRSTARMTSAWVRDLLFVYEGRAHLAAGRPDGVAERMMRVASLARERQIPKDEVHALVVAARAELQAGNAEGALERSSEAMLIHERTGVTGYGTGELYLCHARALRAARRTTDAMRVLERGRELLFVEAARIEDAQWRRRLLGDVEANRRVIEGHLDHTE